MGYQQSRFKLLFLIAVAATPSSAFADLLPLENPSYSIFVVPKSTNTNAYDINDLLQIVGSYTTASRDGWQGFIYQGGSYSTLDFPRAFSTEILGINDLGDMVGWYGGRAHNGLAQGFFYNGSAFTSINYPGATLTILRGVNDSGAIVGFAQDSTRDIYFQYSAGVFKILATFPLGTSVAAGIPVGINSAGQTVGPFSGLLIPGRFTAFPEGINDSGDVAGWYQTTRQQGFLDISGAFYAVDVGLNSSTLPLGLNNERDIVGTTLNAPGCSECGFLLTDATPEARTAEPSPVMLLATALLCVLRLVFRNSSRLRR